MWLYNMFNMQTRMYYDDDVQKISETNSERALKWYTSDLQQNRSLATSNVMEIDVMNQLYMPTASRDADRDANNAELFGTAPFLGRMPDGDSNKIVTENELLHGGVHRAHSCWNKQLPESTYLQMMPAVQVESHRGGTSTRNESIRYCNGK